MASNEEKIEQRTILKFLVKSGCTPKESWTRMLPVFDDKTMCLKTVRIWHKRFLQGETNPKDRPRPGRPRTARSNDNIQKVQAALQTDRRSTLDEMSDELHLSRPSIHTILKKDLNLSKLAPKFVPRLLTQEQKDFCKKLCEDNLQAMKDDPLFLSRIITGDESWISVFEMELKVKSREWLPKGRHTLRPIKAIRNHSEKKAMITIFWDMQGVVHSEYLAPNETVSSDTYCDVLRRLKEAVRRKRPELWHRDNEGYREFRLQHDNASPHTACITLGLIGESGILMVPHPPYSPDLAPSDFFLFPRLKSELRGHRFRTVNDLKIAVQRTLRQIPQQEYRDAILSLPVRWMKCIKAQGSYFEGRHFEINPEEDHELVFEYGNSDDDSD